ncbi:MAG: hypothetical protein OEY14_18210 [Myxococcales bacterium]|nr:hypothetical protein [Myxococcales bacterium]
MARRTPSRATRLGSYGLLLGGVALICLGIFGVVQSGRIDMCTAVGTLLIGGGVVVMALRGLNGD